MARAPKNETDKGKATKAGTVTAADEKKAEKPEKKETLVYIGEHDAAKRLVPGTAYFGLPEGTDRDQFVTLKQYPAWMKKNAKKK